MGVNIIGANGENQRLMNTVKLWFTDQLGDHYWNDTAALAKLNANKRILKQGLGEQIVVPAKNPAPGGPTMQGVTDPYVAVTHKPTRGLTRLKFDVAELLMPFSIPIRERRLQGSATKKVAVYKSWLERQQDDWQQALTNMIFAAETNAKSGGAEDQVASILTLVNKGNGNGTTWGDASVGPIQHPAQSTTTNDLNGWSAATYGATPARANGATAANVVMTIGGINRDAANTGVYYSCPVWTPTTPASLGRDLLNKLIAAGSRGNQRVDTYLCQREIWLAIQGMIQAQQQIGQSKMAAYGFQAFTWNGADFVLDENVPDGLGGSTTGQIIGFNSKALTMVTDEEEPEVEQGAVDTERPLDEWRILYYCQLIPSMIGRGLGVRHNNILKPT